jgi:ABC-type bacteriocin/lantibiotic exporter with double-glycine peptidase domain
MEGFYDLLASVDKLGDLFDLGIESHDRLFHLGKSGPAAVRLVSVGYKYGTKAVISDLSLEFAPGASVAIVGRAGTGKSTLVDMLCGLRTPSSGHVELDGFDLRELRSDSLREHMAVAGSIEIFHGTIDENIHMNRSNVQANDVREALGTVGLLEDVMKQPDGLNAVLQTDGAPLTGSQSQRLMLARAIVGRPRLLIIDGTLDGLPDADIGELMGKLTDRRAPWTLLVITARNDVMAACDRVVQLGKSDAAYATVS